jgi:N-acetylneuraminate synthase
MSIENRTLIIAEAGVNHNGSLEEAKRLIDSAKASDADIVKFQTFKAESLVTKSAALANYQARETMAAGTQFDMLKALELSYTDFIDLANYCAIKNIEFLSTAFDEDSLRFLVKETGIRRIKIPSGEITNGPLIAAAAATGLPLIISTGMANLEEIESLLDVIAWVQGGAKGDYSGKFKTLGLSNLPVQILHCTTEYPAPTEELNLRVICELKKIFGLPVGFSDHSAGIWASVGAVALGATTVEKHFTNSREQVGPDHKASLEPGELSEMVNNIRLLDLALGSGFKRPTISEHSNIKIARKSLVARRSIRMGEQLTPENLTVKRPGSGISPMNYWQIIGKKASRSYAEDDLICEELN